MIPDFKTYIGESVWNDIRRRGIGADVKMEDEVTYSALEDEDCTIEMLYNYLIQNYKSLGDEKIRLNSGKYRGTDWYEVHIPITLDGENIETELDNDDRTKIWSIDFTLNLMKYVKKMNTVEEIDDENFGSDTYARAYTGSSPLLCSSVVDFLDEILSLVPNPALEKKKLVKESVWNDIRRRGIGADVKMEDDINHLDCEEFFVYLTEHYKPKSKKTDDGIGGRTSIMYTNIIEIFIPISPINSITRTLVVEMDKKDNSIISIRTSSTLFDKYINLEKVLSKNYTLHTIKGSYGIYIISKEKPTNRTVTDLIDIFLAVVDDPVLEKVS